MVRQEHNYKHRNTSHYYVQRIQHTSETLHAKSLFDHWRKIPPRADMTGTLVDPYLVHGVEPIFIGFAWLLDTIGGNNDGSWKDAKLEL